MYSVNQWVEDIENNFWKDQDPTFLGCETIHLVWMVASVWEELVSLSILLP
jgi:hypothetical protein